MDLSGIFKNAIEITGAIVAGASAYCLIGWLAKQPLRESDIKKFNQPT